MNRKIEVLAPAGSLDVLKACVRAGADAVYMGGSKFGARAYAKNADNTELLEAISYTHLHGVKLYLTINTLFKEQELEGELYEFLLPLYEAGLDAVIVQDMGVLSAISLWFPKLEIHVSTQMSVTGVETAKILKQQGVTRIVPARELSIKEIRAIYDETGLEIECFVHGALCYCYSGQCLFSSLAGGRSGNRGRCAQPCRLMYDVYDGEKKITTLDTSYVLSPRDLNTLTILPELIEAGVYSLKIEGRMKKAEYAAGVVSKYRKYVDMYLEKGKAGYHVSFEDEKELYDLFHRKEFTKGYYNQHNGRDMITLSKADFRQENEALLERIQEQYLNKETKIPLQGNFFFQVGEPSSLLIAGDAGLAHVTGFIPEPAKKQSATEEDAKKQLSKLGNTDFFFEKLSGYMGDEIFLPVSGVNELRRAGIEAYLELVNEPFRRKAPKNYYDEKKSKNCKEEKEPKTYDAGKKPFELTALVETKEQFKVALLSDFVSRIYVDSCISEAEEYKTFVESGKKVKKEIYLVLPQVFRTPAIAWFSSNKDKIITARFDGFLVRAFEEIGFLKSQGFSGKQIIDHNLYSFNHRAEEFWKNQGALQITVPVELNEHEIKQRGFHGAEMILYGRLPMMVSANCIQKTLQGCNHQPGVLNLVDRKKNVMPVKNHCRYCFNTIYNGLPLSLADVSQSILAMNLSSGRLIFTTESKEECEQTLSLFHQAFLWGSNGIETTGKFTRGHFKRGIE